MVPPLRIGGHTEGVLRYSWERALSLGSDEKEENGNHCSRTVFTTLLGPRSPVRSVCYFVIHCTPTRRCTHTHISQNITLVQMLSKLFSLVLVCSMKAVLVVTHYIDCMPH